MEKMLKHSLRYVISMVVILVLVASYFLIKMGESLNAGRDVEDRLKRENEALLVQSEHLTGNISQFENKVSELQETIAHKQATIVELQNGNDNIVVQGQCGSMSSSETLTSLRSELEAIRTQGSECATALNEENADIGTLKFEVQNLTGPDNELQSAKSAIKDLRNKLIQTQQENERLLQVNRLNSNNEDATGLKTETVQQLEAQLIQGNQEITRLQAQLLKLQAENEGLVAASLSTGELEMIGFQATPQFCNKEFSANRICLLSIDISAKFNFSPNGFVTMLLVAPNGETIGKELVAGRTVNRVTFKLNEKQPAEVGEYYIEFKINDVFNRFSNTQHFMVTAP